MIMTDDRNVLSVRPASSTEDYEFVTEVTKREMMATGPSDSTHVGPKIKPGFFIAELNGEHIGCVSVVRHGDDSNSVFFIGYYIVEKKYRGQGYGRKIWSVMWESIDKSCNIGLDAGTNMISKYEKWGLVKAWTNVMYNVSICKVIDTLVRTDLSGNVSTIKQLESGDHNNLFAYYVSVIGVSATQSFFEAWFTMPEILGFIAENKNGDIVGCVAIRDSILTKDEQLVGPLYADDVSIAKVLLYTVAKTAVSKKAAQILKVISPIDKNPEAENLFVSELEGKVYATMIRMYSSGLPMQYCTNKIFGINSATFD